MELHHASELTSGRLKDYAIAKAIKTKNRKNGIDNSNRSRNTGFLDINAAIAIMTHHATKDVPKKANTVIAFPHISHET